MHHAMHPLMDIDDVARVGQTLFVNNALEHTAGAERHTECGLEARERWARPFVVIDGSAESTGPSARICRFRRASR